MSDRDDVDDFEKADKAAGVQVLPPERSVEKRQTSNVMAYRKQLVEKYHEGAPSLIEKLRQAGRNDNDALLVALVDEVIGESDHLLGNELVATENGELRDASVISFKRAEVLEKAIKAVQAKQEFEKESGIDVDSPAMIIIFRFFMSKAKDSFDRMGVGTEVSDLFFRTFGVSMEFWKKELREHFEELKSPKGG